MDEFRTRVARVRRSLGLNQGEFAALLQVSYVTISRWETGHHLPRGYLVKRFEALERGDHTPVALSRSERDDVIVALEEYLGHLYDRTDPDNDCAASIKNLEAVLAKLNHNKEN